MSTQQARLESALGVSRAVTSMIRPFILREHGVAASAFEPLLRRFGSEVVGDVRCVESGFAELWRSGSHAVDADIRSAATRIYGYKRRLNDPAAWSRIELELRQITGVLATRDEKLLTGYVDSVAERIQVAARKRAALLEAGQGGTAIRSTGRRMVAAGEVLSELGAARRVGARETETIWRLLQLSSADMLAVADVAGRYAPGVARIVRGRKRGADLAIASYLYGVRSAIGERHGFGTKPWLDYLNTQMISAQELAHQMGPGYTARFLAQHENRVYLNGKQAMDGLALIENRRARVGFLTMVAENKIAIVSEGVPQLLRAGQRSAGIQRFSERVLGHLSYLPTGDTEPIVLRLGFDARIETNLFLINAAGSTVPAADRALARRMGRRVDELVLELSVPQFDAVTIDLMGAALRALAAKT